MRQSNRTILAALLAVGLVAAALPPVAGAFDTTQQKCRSTLYKGGAKLTKAYLKAITACHKLRDSDGSQSGTNCNSINQADAVAMKIPTAESKFGLAVDKVCTGTPSTLLYSSCPAPCDVGTPTISTYADVAQCLTCLARDSAEGIADEAFGLPTSPLAAATDLACHASITKNAGKFYDGIVKTIIKCQGKAEKLGTETVDDCAETQFSTLMWKAYVKARAAVVKSCTPATLPSATLDACAGADNVDALAACTVESAWDEGKKVVTQYLNLPTITPPTTLPPTTTLPTAEGCPDRGQLILYSRNSNIACVDNTDCTEPRTCNTDIGRCTTVVDLDTGWRGGGHNGDIDDGVRTRAALVCPNPASPTCGECNVTGVDPEPGNCRCSNDSRVLCNDPFSANSAGCPACSGGPLNGYACTEDSDCSVTGTCGRRCSNNVGKLCTVDLDCPGGSCPALTKCADGANWDSSSTCSGTCEGTCTTTAGCECFLGTPFPLNSGGTPICVVSRFAENLTGTANVDLGEGAITASLRSRVYFGGDQTQSSPCATCSGRCDDDQSICNVNADCGVGPICVLDTPGDGQRDGVCKGGESDGLSCDAGGSNPSSPARFGGGEAGGLYSLDCLPNGASNVTGQGLRIVLNQSTGTSFLPFGLDCDGGGPGTALCPCRVCTKDTLQPCSDDSECAYQGGNCTTYNQVSCTENADCTAASLGTCNLPPGNGKCSLASNKSCTSDADCLAVPAGTCALSTCASNGGGVPTLPNGCNDGLCSDLGGEEGECTTGPDDTFCDGLLKADGGGILTCTSNLGCNQNATGSPLGGTCSHVERRKCFLNPIVASGNPDPEFPVAAATFCVPPTANGGINSVVGLPGPGRIIAQSAASTYCASDRNVQYEPGVGNCPP
jgi:hypothetical protein